MELILILFWFAFSAQQGFNDARHYAHGAAHYMKQNQGYNIHLSLLLGRLLVFLLILVVNVFLLIIIYGAFSNHSFQMIGALGLGLALTFPFLADGTYYSSRKLIDNPPEYPKTHFALWVDYKSPSTTSKVDRLLDKLKLRITGYRVIMFIAGVFFCLIPLTS